jgi:hypothetical protein
MVVANSATTSRTITWTSDLVPPVITATGTATSLGCNPTAAQIDAALGTATATDACSTVSVSASDGSVSTTTSVHLRKQEYLRLLMVVVTQCNNFKNR